MNTEQSKKDLFDAILNDDEATVKKLIKKGIDVNVQNKAKVTPLILAADMGNEKIVAELLKAGANTKMTDNRGITAQEAAEENGYDKTAQMIILSEQKRVFQILSKLGILNIVFKIMLHKNPDLSSVNTAQLLSKKEKIKLSKLIEKKTTAHGKARRTQKEM